MKKQYVLCLAAMLLAGCHDDSGSSSSESGCQCKEGQVCSGAGICYDDAACASCIAGEVCVSGKCYDAESACGKCTASPVCVNDKCYNPEDPCAKCGESQVCVTGVCIDKSSPCAACKEGEKCVGDTCYANSSPCYSCNSDQVCHKDVCYQADDPCLKCKDNEICETGTCKVPVDPCDACLTSDKCVDGQCIPCEYEICQGACCGLFESCDLYTGKCAMSCPDLTPTCNGECCESDMYCTQDGICDRACDHGSSCGPQKVCCSENQVCLNNDHCGPACGDDQFLCGDAGAEVCCDNGLACYKGACHSSCTETQTRCGADNNLCCDNETELCLFGKCLTRGTECESTDDCELWEFCEQGSKTCVDQDNDTTRCIYKPEIAAFEPAVKWQNSEMGTMLGPIIALNLTDDNGDGKIDENDVPDILGTTDDTAKNSKDELVSGRGTLYALSGDTGKVLARGGYVNRVANDGYNNQTTFVHRYNIGAAKVNGDEYPEIVIGSGGKTGYDNASLEAADQWVYILNLVPDEPDPAEPDVKKYKFIEKAKLHPTYMSCSETNQVETHASFADLDGDGKVEIVTVTGIIELVEDSNGDKSKDTYQWRCHFKDSDLPGNTGWYVDDIVVADLDGDGKSEIISNAIFDYNCNTVGPKLYPRDDKESMIHIAIGDMLEDNGKPGEVVPELVWVTHNGKVKIVKVYKTVGENGEVLWTQEVVKETSIPCDSTKHSDCASTAGPPVLAHFDGDGKVDIGVAAKYSYVALRNDLTMLWQDLTTQDKSSANTGSSVFDFNGDGIAEVVYRDELRLRIYAGPGMGDGVTPKTVIEDIPCYSDTVSEYPLILDVNNDGKTEIVVNCKRGTKTDESTPNLSGGIMVLSDPEGNWVRTRRIWNQFSYHVTNINEDGTVPRPEKANWLQKRLNNYRANTQPDNAFNAPNLTAGELKSEYGSCPDRIKLTATVNNIGSMGARDIWVTFYATDVDTGSGNKETVLLGSEKTNGAVIPGGTAAVSLEWDLKGTSLRTGEPVTLKAPYHIMYKVDDNPDVSKLVDLYHECDESDNAASVTEVAGCKVIIN